MIAHRRRYLLDAIDEIAEDGLMCTDTAVCLGGLGYDVDHLEDEIHSKLLAGDSPEDVITALEEA